MFLFCCYKKRRLSLEIFNLYQTRFLLAKCHQQKYDRNADKLVSDLHKKVLHLQSAEFFSPSDYETSFYFSCIGQMRFFFWLNLINMFKETIFLYFYASTCFTRHPRVLIHSIENYVRPVDLVVFVRTATVVHVYFSRSLSN